MHKLPTDLQKAIFSDKKAISTWEDITPLARNEWICWTISVKKKETREKHIKELLKTCPKANAVRVAGPAVHIDKYFDII